MQKKMLNASLLDRTLFGGAFWLGALAVGWTGAVFLSTDTLAFTITVVIGCVYLIGAIELLTFGRATSTLRLALDATQANPVDHLETWLDRLDPSLRGAVRQRVEGERAGLPAPVLTPYLVGLLVMLGLLGTFVGMVDTLRGAVAALEGTTELIAIRQGLAAPINGLGMAFGTSVAGVATSAMLGFMSTIHRRRRILETRRLDAQIPIDFKIFSLAHSQRETFQALRRQSHSLPAVAGMLETVAGKLDQLGDALLDSQARFQQSTDDRYARLADTMDQKLDSYLSANVHQVGEAVKSVVDGVMQTLAQETASVHRHLSRLNQEALDGINQKMVGLGQDLAASWRHMIADHQAAGEAILERMQDTFKAFLQQHDQAAVSILDTIDASAKGWIDRQKASDQTRLATWQDALEAMQQQAAAHLADVSSSGIEEFTQLAEVHRTSIEAATREFLTVSASLADAWQQAGNASRQRQTELSGALSNAVDELRTQTQTMTCDLQTEMTRLMASSADLVQSRRQTEAAWVRGHAARMDALTSSLAEQLTQLRQDEDHRGQAAVARLEQLESTLTSHLSTLGQALEAPMARLIETAAEAPRAAAGLVEQMRRERANQVHRDHRLLDERRRIMEQLDALCVSMNANLTAQGETIEQLVASAKGMLAAEGNRFADQVGKDLAKLSAANDAFAVSAVEMASLGESFGKAMELFNEANRHLVDNLDRIEGALDHAAARSDDQLGYFVAQAREIIDHSLLSQKEIFEAIRQLRPAAGRDLEAN